MSLQAGTRLHHYGLPAVLQNVYYFLSVHCGFYYKDYNLRLFICSSLLNSYFWKLNVKLNTKLTFFHHLQINFISIYLKSTWNENLPYFLNACFRSCCEQFICAFFFFFELVNVYSKFTTGPSTDFTLMIYTDQA